MEPDARKTGLALGLLLIAACGPAELPATLDREGEPFDLTSPPAQEHTTEAESPRALRSLALRVDGPADQRLATASREELAEALRAAVMDRSGALYLQRQPNWKAADAVLGAKPQLRTVDAVAAAAGRDHGPPDQPHSVGPLGPLARVIGGDGRTLAMTGTHPFSAIARLEIDFSDGSLGQCSGAYIGRWTLLTAAHCLVTETGARATRIRFQPQRAGATTPFDFDCRLDDRVSRNDVAWAVPAGFVANPAGAHSLDYGVIDTWPCHAAPARFAGYAVWPNDETYAAFGYPGDRCPGASEDGTFQCGMSGPAYDTDGWILETEHVDATGGQSGGPWFRRVAGTPRVMGIDWAYREYFDFGRCGFDVCRRNAARLIDDAVDLFIKANSFDY